MSFSPPNRVPDATFISRENGQFLKLTSKDVFAGRKVVLFALPGAFTPTCSTNHLPRYDQLTPVFKENGVDDVICLSVNDGFVMEAWQKNLGAKHVRFLADGNAEFSEKMGLAVDKPELGFGKRSWRYSMLVDDGAIDKIFIEPEKPGDPFEVSDADTMMKAAFPNAKYPDEVTIITRPGCQFCTEAKELLAGKGYEYEEIAMGHGISYASLKNLTGKHTAPQIVINGKAIDGLAGLKEYFAST